MAAMGLAGNVLRTQARSHGKAEAIAPLGRCPAQSASNGLNAGHT